MPQPTETDFDRGYRAGLAQGLQNAKTKAPRTVFRSRELKRIRKFVMARPSESTYDAVRRAVRG